LNEAERSNGWRLACRVIPAEDMTLEVFNRDATAVSVPAVSDLAARGQEGRCGIAVDIGTTTVEAALVDMESGREIAVRSAVNPQTRFGMDVLSRISHAIAHPEGVGVMQRAIVEQLDAMTEELCRTAGADFSSVSDVAVAANCAMLHLLLGVNPAPLGSFPFAPAFVDSRELPASDAGLRKLARDARLYCLPSVSAFIGADIVAGIHVSDLARQKGSALFIDIGTNGEMALSRGGSLASCSCAAGPALEGMNIRCGARAAPGAIEDVAIDSQGAVRLKVIENASPSGICGSGILAAIKELLRVGLVRPDGALWVLGEELPPGMECFAGLCRVEDGIPAVRLSDRVLVTQKDIRQVQLAKGALLSGVRALLNWAELEDRDIDKVFVAGQFGAHLSAESLTGCGILPSSLGGKIEYIGNSSKEGARRALLSRSARAEMEKLARSVTYLDLGSTPGYSDLFMECLEFPSFSLFSSGGE
jgi:uncharacterized 2Fe-2S/4Fe-4S cluster protein (DUF4445 family)